MLKTIRVILNTKLFTLSALVCLIVVAVLLRARLFFFHDFYFLVDQARDMLLTKSIVVDHKITLIGARSGEGGLFHGPLWLYIIAPFFFLAHGNPFYTLVPLYMLVSMLIVFAGFYIGYKLYNVYTGLLFTLLLTLSGTLIQNVPFTTNSDVLPLVFIFYLYTAIQYIRGKDLYFIANLICIGLGFQFESAFAILFIPLTICMVLIRWHLPSIKIFGLGIAGFFIGISTFLLFDIRHNFLMTSTLMSLLTHPMKPLPGFEQYANLNFRIIDRAMSLKDSIFTPLFTQNTLSSLMLLSLILIPIILVIKHFIIKHTLQKNDREYLFLLITPFVIYGLYIFYPLPLWSHYLISVSVLAVFILSVSIKRVCKYSWGIYLSLFFLILITIPALTWIKNNYVEAQTYKTDSEGSYKNQLEVAEWVVRDAQNKQAGYFIYTPGTLTYNMDYLLWWVSQDEKAPSLLPQKKPTTYLILYPHLSGDLHAYDYWEKYMIRTQAKPFFSKKFTGNITVEKVQMSEKEESPNPNYYQNLIFR